MCDSKRKSFQDVYAWFKSKFRLVTKEELI